MTRTDIFITLLNMSISASFCILIVLTARLLLKRLPRNFTILLWAVVLFRLLCPFTLEGALSLLPVPARTVPRDIASMSVPEIQSGIAAVDQTVNASLPAAAAHYSANPMQLLLNIVSLVWCLGLFLLLGYGIISSILLRRRLSGAVPLDNTTAGHIYVVRSLKTPFVLGILRPRIYLPDTLTEEELPYVLCHEQMHIRRKDHILKPIAFFALCLHWFNPLVWAAFTLLCRDLEMACDEAVIRTLGTSVKKEYSSAMLSLATGHRILSGMPLAFGEGEVKGRVKNVLRYRKPAFWAVVCAVLLVLCLCIGLLLNPGKETASEGEPSETVSSLAPSWLADAWKWRTPYVGSASAVGNITDAWNTFYDAQKTGFELYTDETPYGMTLRYAVSSDLLPQEVWQNYHSILEENVGILFALIENLGYAEIEINATAEQAGYTWFRSSYESLYGDLWEQSETLEGLQELWQNMNQDTDSRRMPDLLSSYTLTEKEAQSLLLQNEAYQRLLALFPDYADWQMPDAPAEADLDGDGIAEQIIASDLGHNGGDGGCSILVLRLINGEYQPVPLPEAYSGESGFPIQMSWNGEALQILFGENASQNVSADLLNTIYTAGGMAELMEMIQGNPETISADAVSGFSIYQNQDGKNVLVLKQYLTGPGGGHACRIGYGITELILQEDSTWEISQYYLPAY